MRWISAYKGTITAGPNFSYILAARALKRMSDSGELLDLGTLRIALNGAEPIDCDSMEKFISIAGKHKFRRGAEFCAFGMAEVTIGGTFPPLMRGISCDCIDRIILEEEKRAVPISPESPQAKHLALLGSPLPGLEMQIRDPDSGQQLGLRQVGELVIKGNSVTSGYYKNPEATSAVLQDGWLRTGDLGYFVEGPGNSPDELVICGRIKDIIIVAGRNIYPEDIERATASVEGVRPGNVIAFSIEGHRGKEAVVVVAEFKGNVEDTVLKNIRFRVLSVCGVAPKEVVLVKPGTLPKTSSGKLQRSLCRKQYLEGTLKEL